MTGGRIEAFLKLFCITDSRHGSWQSWTVLCICLVSAIATASSGGYFQRTNAVKSAVVCYIVSTAGFSMALVTLIAILIGCKRRRRIIDPEALHGEPTIYENPITSEQRSSIEIEEGSPESRSVEQMWMNPVFAEYDKSLYEADWNKKENGRSGEKDSDTDFEERDSDCFRSSSETMTWSYKSYSEDEGYFPHSSKESNLKESGKSHRMPLKICQEAIKCTSKHALSSDLKEAGVSYLKHHKHRTSMPQVGLEDTRAHSLNSMVSDNSLKQNFSNASQNSEFNSFQVSHNLKSRRVFQNCSRNSLSSTSCFEAEKISNDNLAFVKKYGLHLYYDNEPDPDVLDNENVAYFHDGTPVSVASRIFSDNGVAYEEHNGTRLINTQESHNGYALPTFIRINELSKQFEKENVNSKYLMRNKVSKSCLQSDECHILSNSVEKLSTIVTVEDYKKATESCTRENSLTTLNVFDSTLSHEDCPTINEMSPSNLSHKEKLAKNSHSINKFDYPPLPYPIFEDDCSNFDNLEREEFFIPRYVKRPLLDINGDPISQKELVKVITRLLISGLPNIQKSTSKCEALEK